MSWVLLKSIFLNEKMFWFVLIEIGVSERNHEAITAIALRVS
jgi:hypothetical protein|tara:strand:+ start:830 stop:955 length:126 start_codon:yes stop_codon:yes gene_type:complete